MTVYSDVCATCGRIVNPGEVAHKVCSRCSGTSFISYNLADPTIQRQHEALENTWQLERAYARQMAVPTQQAQLAIDAVQAVAVGIIIAAFTTTAVRLTSGSPAVFLVTGILLGVFSPKLGGGRLGVGVGYLVTTSVWLAGFALANLLGLISG